MRLALLALPSLAMFSLATADTRAETPRRLPPPVAADPCTETVYPVTAASYLTPASFDEPAPIVESLQPVALEASLEPPQLASGPDYELGALFDKGVFIRSTDLEERPTALYIGARFQLRHTAFTRDNETWTDQAGVTRTIRNRNNFDSERLRLNLSGTALDPNLTYYIIFDGDADGGSNVDQLAYIFTYEIAPQLKVRMGRWKAASDREWLMSSRFFRMVDRSLATEYFRAGFTDGVWLLGDLGDAWHYEASLTNGLRTSTRRAFDLDDNFGVAATFYVDPLGSYGPGEQDYAYHCTPVVRLGGSVAFDKSDDRSDAGFPLGDDGFLRLSDGTRLSDVGALAPGVRLLGDRVLKGSVDWGVKYRGWSFSGEYFVRSIHDLVADGALPVEELYDYGFHVAGGVFLRPKRFDVNARMSQVSGLFGDGFEYSLGCNYYWGNGKRDGKLADRVNKWSFDVAEIKGSPTSSTPADYLAGDDGVMFRTQVQIGF